MYLRTLLQLFFLEGSFYPYSLFQELMVLNLQYFNIDLVKNK